MKSEIKCGLYYSRMDKRTVELRRKKRKRVEKMKSRITQLKNYFMRDPWNNKINYPIINFSIDKYTEAISIESIDMRKICSKVKNQNDITSCTVFAIVAILEYFNPDKKFSEMFLYYFARTAPIDSGGKNLTVEDIVGISIGSVLKILENYGCCEEEYFEHTKENLYTCPPDDAKTSAIMFPKLSYARLDDPYMPRQVIINKMKVVLNAKIPILCGFMMPVSIRSESTRNSGRVDYAWLTNKGHAVAIFGYDDNAFHKGMKGCFIFKNSWGKKWGDRGFGYLPYKFILHKKCYDIWAVDLDMFSKIPDAIYKVE